MVIEDGLSKPASVDFELDIKLGTASLSGEVKHEDGQALAGAQVTITPHYDHADSSTIVDFPWASQLYTYTDSLGQYTFDYLPEGVFILSASYWEEGASGFEWYEDAADIFDATPVNVGENDVITGIDFSLDVRSYYGSIAGLVGLNDGSPIERAFIEVSSAYHDYDFGDLAFFPAEWYGITDANGEFQIDYLFEGEYLLKAYAQGAIRSAIDSSGVEISKIKSSGWRNF